MTRAADDSLPAPQRIACAWAPPAMRDATLALFLLDQHCAGLVRQSREPGLAQIRLAWWREMLVQPVASRPRGDRLLDSLASWEGHEKPLVEVVAGWEFLLGEPPLPQADFAAFAKGRAEGWAGLARLAGLAAAAPAALAAGQRWALADLACHISRAEERACVLDLASSLLDRRLALPRALRPLAVLEGLARRALARGGTALLSTRTDALAALRLGMTGR